MDKAWEKIKRNSILGSTEDDCMIWNGATNSTGTPIMHYKYRVVTVSRLAYHCYYHEKPKGTLYRTCKNSLCVNPRHFYYKKRFDVRYITKETIKEIKACCDTSSGCWLPNEPKPTFRHKTGMATGHGIYRKLYEAYYNKIGALDTVVHTCQNPECLNPEHLQVKMSSQYSAKIKILDKEYINIREAHRHTGISLTALAKHNKEGIFQVENYRKACINSNQVPAI